MNIAEATREYQTTLEAERRVRTECRAVVSMLDVLDDAAEELEHARDRMALAWCKWAAGRLA